MRSSYFEHVIVPKMDTVLESLVVMTMGTVMTIDLPDKEVLIRGLFCESLSVTPRSLHRSALSRLIFELTLSHK